MPSSSKYVLAALVYYWFKNQARNMACVIKIFCSGNWLVTQKTEVSGQFRVRHSQEHGDSYQLSGTVRTVTWYRHVH